MKSFLLVILLLAASVSGQQYDDYQQQQQEGGQGGYQENTQENENAAGGGNSVDGNGPLDPSVPEPPSQIPETSFVCDGKPYDPGMYADEETGCRVYHMCYRGKKESFICGTGTIFNQEILSCDYPEKVDCSASPNFYEANSELGKSSPEPSNQGNQGSNGKPRPAAGQQPEFGGADDAEQPAQRPGGDYDTPRGAARPRTPAVRPPPPPSGPRPSQGGYEPAQGGVDQPNYRPNAPGPAPRPRAKTNQPRQPAGQQPNYRPANGGADRPAARPAGKANRPRPVDRPVVQENDQVLDYEPSQIVQQRVNRQAYARQQRAFQRRSGRWQVMSTAY